MAGFRKAGHKLCVYTYVHSIHSLCTMQYILYMELKYVWYLYIKQLNNCILLCSYACMLYTEVIVVVIIQYFPLIYKNMGILCEENMLVNVQFHHYQYGLIYQLVYYHAAGWSYVLNSLQYCCCFVIVLHYYVHCCT